MLSELFDWQVRYKVSGYLSILRLWPEPQRKRHFFWGEVFAHSCHSQHCPLGVSGDATSGYQRCSSLFEICRCWRHCCSFTRTRVGRTRRSVHRSWNDAVFSSTKFDLRCINRTTNMPSDLHCWETRQRRLAGSRLCSGLSAAVPTVKVCCQWTIHRMTVM